MYQLRRVKLSLTASSHEAIVTGRPFFEEVCLPNLLKTAVSVLASTVKLTVSFMEPLVTVSVMLRCSQQAASSSGVDVAESFCESEEGADTLVSSQPSQPEWHEKRGKNS